MATYTAYLDESGTHHGAKVSLMAGFVGDDRQWRKFEKRSGKLFKRHRVDIFHTIDVRRGDADFARWSVDRKLGFLDEFQHIVNATIQAGVTSVLREDDYAYYSKLEWHKKSRLDSKNAILFRRCLAH